MQCFPLQCGVSGIFQHVRLSVFYIAHFFAVSLLMMGTGALHRGERGP